MCGIVGFLGHRPAASVLLGALRKLEYRGYDSAGITTLLNARFERRRAVGKIRNLSRVLDADPVCGLSGIGHTRWATHGAATLENTHPHQTESVSVVHNGIIENFRELKHELTGLGYNFSTETDTEIVTVRCQSFLDQGHPPRAAVRKTLGALKGVFALLFLFRDEENLLIAARQGSPLVIGHGEDETYIVSDAIALAGLTNSATFLEDGDCACISRGALLVTDQAGNSADRVPEVIDIQTSGSGKGKFRHYMAKEIHEQPEVLAGEIDTYVTAAGTVRMPPGAPDFREIDRVVLAACGTAYLVCKIAAYWIEKLARIPAHAEIASEFRYRDSVLDPRTLTIFVSQSGETADTLAALRHAIEQGCPNLAVLNNTSSAMARAASSIMPIHAGTEVSVASTKAFTCQLVALAILATAAGRQRQSLTSEQERDIVQHLKRLPVQIGSVLHRNGNIPNVARALAGCTNALFIGRGTMYPVALEGALKLKEISYIHAEGLASGELKHGPIALVDEQLPVVVLAPPGQLFEKTASNLEEVKARYGRVILVTGADCADAVSQGAWFTIKLPDADPLFAPILYAVPLQLLAYHAAVAIGTDVDHPRNLAKSVTVE